MSNSSNSLVHALTTKLFVAIFLISSANAIFAQNTAFTYQGKLSDGGTAADGAYDMQFILCDAAGNPVKRFRGEGKPHGGKDPPLVLEPKPGKGPGSQPKVPRPPRPDELPKGYDRE